MHLPNHPRLCVNQSDITFHLFWFFFRPYHQPVLFLRFSYVIEKLCLQSKGRWEKGFILLTFSYLQAHKLLPFSYRFSDFILEKYFPKYVHVASVPSTIQPGLLRATEWFRYHSSNCFEHAATTISTRNHIHTTK